MFPRIQLARNHAFFLFTVTTLQHELLNCTDSTNGFHKCGAKSVPEVSYPNYKWLMRCYNYDYHAWDEPLTMSPIISRVYHAHRRYPRSRPIQWVSPQHCELGIPLVNHVKKHVFHWFSTLVLPWLSTLFTINFHEPGFSMALYDKLGRKTRVAPPSATASPGAWRVGAGGHRHGVARQVPQDLAGGAQMSSVDACCWPEISMAGGTPKWICKMPLKYIKMDDDGGYHQFRILLEFWHIKLVGVAKPFKAIDEFSDLWVESNNVT